MMIRSLMSMLALVAAGLLVVGCEVEDEGQLPNVETEGGRAPQLDVDVEGDAGALPDVNVEGGRAPDIDLGDVEVETETREIEVPSRIEIQTPAEDEAEDQAEDLIEGEPMTE